MIGFVEILPNDLAPQIEEELADDFGAEDSEENDDSSDDEVIPQKSFRLHSFIESLRAMQARLPQKKEDQTKPLEEPSPPLEDSPPKLAPSATPAEAANLKNKWLQSLENRSKVKPPEPTPAVNKIQSDIAQLKDKNFQTLI